jgi:hypothetical protein
VADRVSDKPIMAPADYQAGERKQGSVEDLGYKRWGPGWPTALACGACGNLEGNVEIFDCWWVDHGGDATENHEVRCARCGKFSLYIREL